MEYYNNFLSIQLVLQNTNEFIRPLAEVQSRDGNRDFLLKLSQKVIILLFLSP